MWQVFVNFHAGALFLFFGISGFWPLLLDAQLIFDLNSLLKLKAESKCLCKMTEKTLIGTLHSGQSKLLAPQQEEICKLKYASCIVLQQPPMTR